MVDVRFELTTNDPLSVDDAIYMLRNYSIGLPVKF